MCHRELNRSMHTRRRYALGLHLIRVPWENKVTTWGSGDVFPLMLVLNLRDYVWLTVKRRATGSSLLQLPGAKLGKVNCYHGLGPHEPQDFHSLYLALGLGI